MLKPGDSFQIPPNTPHAGGAAGTAKSRLVITYVVEKGKPLATPA
jgi:quercetin dioxygenase-like cupin family protein